MRVERLDQSDPILLAPAQSTYLRENLKIRLLTARLALLARDGRTYAADLAQARGWIERFFDTRDSGVQDALAELAALQSMPIKVEQPSPTESFAALRLLQVRNSAARQPDPAAAARDGRAESTEPGASKPATQTGGAAEGAARSAAGASRSEPRGASAQVPRPAEGSVQDSAKPGGAPDGAREQSRPAAPSPQPPNPSPAQPSGAEQR